MPVRHTRYQVLHKVWWKNISSCLSLSTRRDVIGQRSSEKGQLHTSDRSRSTKIVGYLTCRYAVLCRIVYCSTDTQIVRISHPTILRTEENRTQIDRTIKNNESSKFWKKKTAAQGTHRGGCSVVWGNPIRVLPWTAQPRRSNELKTRPVRATSCLVQFASCLQSSAMLHVIRMYMILRSMCHACLFFSHPIYYLRPSFLSPSY